MELKEIKTVDLSPGSRFTANGKTYIVSEQFAIGRFAMFESLEEELIMLGDKRSCHDVMSKAMQKINQVNFGEAYTMMYNKIESDQKNARLSHYTLRMVAIFINWEGEDTRYITEETIKQKLTDWSEEGLSIVPFLVFGASVSRTFLEQYKAPLVQLLSEAKEVKEALAEVLDIQSLTGSSGPERFSESSYPTSDENGKHSG